MEQNMQSSKNDDQAKNDVLFGKPKKKNSSKTILLVIAVVVILGIIASYFLFFSDKENDNAPVSENKKVEEVKIDKELDSDQDGLPDYIEKVLETDLNNSDTDGDGYSDFEEIENGYDPLGDGKYIEEEWEAVKEEIRSENEELYSEMFKDSGKSASCDAFPDKLDLCESFSCEFKHPLTDEIMKREIIGLVDGKCQYTEGMPNNSRMDCECSRNLRKAIAQYYRDIITARSAGAGVEVNLGSDDIKTIYTIDGEEVENPLQEAMDSGQCIISGYNNSETNYNLEVDIKFPKNTYEFDETLNGEYYLKYEGESFKGILSASLSKEGFAKESFIGMTKTTIETQPKTIVKKSIFAEKAVECEGTYVYTFSVYDCVDIDNALDTQSCGGSWNSGLQEMIENKVKPKATISEVISVVCKDGKEGCDPVNYVWACDNFRKKCEEGYKCEQYKCVLE